MNKNLKLINNIGILVFIITILILVIWGLRQNFQLFWHHKYTIGTVNSYTLLKTTYRVDYTMNINGEEFNASNIDGYYHPNIIRKRYYVKYNPDNPKNSAILLDKPVSESIKEAPPDGWDKIPE